MRRFDIKAFEVEQRAHLLFDSFGPMSVPVLLVKSISFLDVPWDLDSILDFSQVTIVPTRFLFLGLLLCSGTVSDCSSSIGSGSHWWNLCRLFFRKLLLRDAIRSI